ncbi:hypothetical protein G5I_06345 [Acromyrmex echinatior]|uniref:Uncharacterized protein n=1 Tax=Acromyrmex echinatior TaxID=103372 RepID=F4WKS5_ACREC|nr:hypothetical protein G5I_06345 [Acromyrmex echinatior]
MKARKYGTVVCEGGQSSGGCDGVYGERKRVDTSLKVERKYEKVKESETVLIKKVFETAQRNREIARIPVNNGPINLTSFLKTRGQIELKTSNQSFSDLDRLDDSQMTLVWFLPDVSDNPLAINTAKLSAVRHRGLCGYVLRPSVNVVAETYPPTRTSIGVAKNNDREAPSRALSLFLQAGVFTSERYDAPREEEHDLREGHNQLTSSYGVLGLAN